MDERAYEFIRDNQFNHWWWHGKRRVIESTLHHFFHSKQQIEFLDIGSGYGALIPTLRRWGEVDCIEPHTDAHEMLKDLGARNIYTFTDFPLEYPDRKYDCVCLFDVLEHLPDDQHALSIIKNHLLTHNGLLLITVPAYQWLWSTHDELHKHFRRYVKRTLTQMLKQSGFYIMYSSYFMTLLFPLALLNRLVQRITNPKSSELSKPPRPVNHLFKAIFGLESRFVPHISLPYGLSILIVASASQNKNG